MPFFSYTFECPECGNQALADISEIIANGIPNCWHCPDHEMNLKDDAETIDYGAANKPSRVSGENP